MDRAFVAVALAAVSIPALVFAQPLPSVAPGTAPSAYEAQPLPPPGPAAATVAPAPARPLPRPVERVFCEQPVTVQLADPNAVAEPYRAFIGIWSDASWTPSQCAALVVQSVMPDGTAALLYVFGPMGTNLRGPGGVLRGTGIIRDGELRFQNSDGSQFAFRPVYADLSGLLTTPRGESHEAFFKKTP